MTASSDDTDSAVLFCLPRRPGSPPVPSTEQECSVCGAVVWASIDSTERLRSEYSDKLEFQCVTHMRDDPNAVALVPHWQREQLNAKGISDERIDEFVRSLNERRD